MSICNMNTPTAEQLASPQWWELGAPEGAELFVPAEGVFFAAFYKHEQGAILSAMAPCYNWTGVAGHRDLGAAIPRPAWPAVPEWDGTGLPPVGCECKVAHHGHWIPAKIVAHGEDHGEAVAFCQTEFLPLIGDATQFRPLRTQAVRERDDLARALLDDLDALDINMPGDTARAIAISIMNRGWIRVER